MTLLTVVRDVCAVVGVELPTSVFTNLAANRTMQEMLALANEMAQRVAYDTREWTRLRKIHTCVGDGAWVPPQPNPAAVWTGTTAFTLPADYQRMLLTTNLWLSRSTQNPAKFIADPDEWIRRRLRNTIDGFGEWTIYNGQIHILPVMPALATAMFVYLQKNCIALGSGGFGDTFISDADCYVLSERVLKLAMIWQWKAQKGSPYAEDMGNYGDALNVASGADSPAPILIDKPTVSGGFNAVF
jgi:hypothetical protein